MSAQKLSPSQDLSRRTFEMLGDEARSNEQRFGDKTPDVLELSTLADLTNAISAQSGAGLYNKFHGRFATDGGYGTRLGRMVDNPNGSQSTRKSVTALAIKSLDFVNGDPELAGAFEQAKSAQANAHEQVMQQASSMDLSIVSDMAEAGKNGHFRGVSNVVKPQPGQSTELLKR